MSRFKVLLVEDDVGVREVLSAYLAVDGYDVVEAGDGVEGLDLAISDAPDLIVTDIMMPNLDGLGLVKRLRQDDTLRQIPVLLISGHCDSPGNMNTDPHNGQVAFLPKPISLGGFLAAVHKLRRTKAQV